MVRVSISGAQWICLIVVSEFPKSIAKQTKIQYGSVKGEKENKKEKCGWISHEQGYRVLK